ncbi:protein-tyrosine phosphatase [Methylohalomonas lacus]|uniref:protein-tyrosine-phosphatase n=1 Tax=Methylohalomonas lacus TaxID=398773 RepID=A0AAE3HKE5_9GAMM|nr:low molecular weight protein-tyrosine-phosphatase [Methylohalomonas lacus]MCS3902761.1 protein-tyrosine phosphatase [Methylohalomonas lacus]
MTDGITGVLFVCTGNICRSPTAHGLLQQRLDAAGLTPSVQVDSAATHAYQLGQPPDAFAVTVAARHGIDISALRARRIERQDFFAADIIAVMDRANLMAVHKQAPASQAHKIRLLLDFADGGEIADPYGQPLAAFETAFARIDQGVAGLLATLGERPPASADGR